MAGERPSARAVLGGVAFRTGVLAGLGAVAATGLVVYLLSLISWDPLQTALGIDFGGDEPSTRARIGRSVLFGWLGQTNIEGSDFEVTNRGLIPLSWFLLAGALGLAGIWVRRSVPASVRQRTVALLAAAAVAAIVLAILAATISWDADFGGPAPVGFSFSPWWFAAAGLVQALVIGAFAFGVVETWRPSLRVPAQAAGAVVGAVVLTVVLLFPAFVVAGTPTASPRSRSVATDFARASSWAPGSASAALPLALGAEARLQTGAGLSPFSTGAYVYWPELDRYTATHETARIDGYASVGGRLWAGVVWFGAALLVLLWIGAAVFVVHALGASRWPDGLRHGAVLGAFGFLLLALLGWLGTFVSTAVSESVDLDQELWWGMTAEGSVQAGLELVVLAAVAGAVYAALRPSPAAPAELDPPDTSYAGPRIV
jgi:hypothetical protein